MGTTLGDFEACGRQRLGGRGRPGGAGRVGAPGPRGAGRGQGAGARARCSQVVWGVWGRCPVPTGLRAAGARGRRGRVRVRLREPRAFVRRRRPLAPGSCPRDVFFRSVSKRRRLPRGLAGCLRPPAQLRPGGGPGPRWLSRRRSS